MSAFDVTHRPRPNEAVAIWWGWVRTKVGDPVDRALYEQAMLANVTLESDTRAPSTPP